MLPCCLSFRAQATHAIYSRDACPAQQQARTVCPDDIHRQPACPATTTASNRDARVSIPTPPSIILFRQCWPHERLRRKSRAFRHLAPSLGIKKVTHGIPRGGRIARQDAQLAVPANYNKACDRLGPLNENKLLRTARLGKSNRSNPHHRKRRVRKRGRSCLAGRPTCARAPKSAEHINTRL